MTRKGKGGTFFQKIVMGLLNISAMGWPHFSFGTPEVLRISERINTEPLMDNLSILTERLHKALILRG